MHFAVLPPLALPGCLGAWVSADLSISHVVAQPGPVGRSGLAQSVSPGPGLGQTGPVLVQQVRPPGPATTSSGITVVAAGTGALTALLLFHWRSHHGKCDCEVWRDHVE